jgi:Fe-S-cluster containining protein
MRKIFGGSSALDVTDIRQNRKVYLPFLKKLKGIYAEMDETYRDAAGRYGFDCTGCEDNCCRTRFYHYTHAEYLYILEGYYALSSRLQEQISGRALRAVRKSEETGKKGVDARIMCPLNHRGMCRMYAHRPMICRLHGIPHELRRPDGVTLYRPGCGAFTERCGKNAYVAFDRTSFYTQMAGLENELRSALGFTRKIKMSIARMISTPSIRQSFPDKKNSIAKNS